MVYPKQLGEVPSVLTFLRASGCCDIVLHSYTLLEQAQMVKSPAANRASGAQIAHGARKALM